jgi:hypothetical protein
MTENLAETNKILRKNQRILLKILRELILFNEDEDTDEETKLSDEMLARIKEFESEFNVKVGDMHLHRNLEDEEEDEEDDEPDDIQPEIIEFKARKHRWDLAT